MRVSGRARTSEVSFEDDLTAGLRYEALQAQFKKDLWRNRQTQRTLVLSSIEQIQWSYILNVESA